MGSKIISPVPVYSGLIADSPVTFPLTILENKSPAPLIPVVAFAFPIIHCIAPACIVTGDFARLHITCLFLTFIKLLK